MQQARPTAATVFAILNFVWAAFGFLGSGMAVAGNAFMKSMAEQTQNPQLVEMTQNATLRTFTYIAGGLGCVASIMLLMAGIGLLTMKPYGRTLSIVWAVYSVLMTVAAFLVNLFNIYLPQMHGAAAATAQAGQADPAAGLIVGILSGVCGLVYPVLLLVFMLSAGITAAYTSAPAAAHVNPYAPPAAGTPYQSPPREGQDGGWKSDD